MNTVEFFNSFTNSVEKKISDVSKKITSLEVLLAVLEAKLGSVDNKNDDDDDDDDDNENDEKIEPKSTPATTHADAEQNQITPVIPSNTSADAQSQEIVHSESESEVKTGEVSIADDPDYAPFIKLLNVGVPFPVIAAKATAAGISFNIFTLLNYILIKL